MGKRRLTRVDTSDDEDDSPPPMSPNKEEERRSLRKRRKKTQLIDEEDEEEEEHERGRNKKKAEDEDEEEPTKSAGEDDDEEEEEEEQVDDAKPIGEVIKTVTEKKKGKRNFYAAFEYDGIRYELEDPVLLVPEETTQKPYVAIIKDIAQNKDGSIMVNGQWFYRPEEAHRKGGGNWQSRDTRELFYSFHRDEVPAESVMHKCVVHFIPLHKQIPHRKEHPGFIVQKVYDTEQNRLFKLTDKDYEDVNQLELDVLVQKTLSRLGDIPDIEIEDTSADQEDRSRSKRMLRKKNISLLDVSRDDEATTKSGQTPYGETPRSVTSNASEYYIILSKFEALTGETQRDRWLEKLLSDGFQFIRTPTGNEKGDDKEKSDDAKFVWPNSAVRAVSALEKAAHDILSVDFHKYNQKMRSLHFNLKSNESLSRRLLNGELEPATIVNMSSNELKVGLTAEEIASREPEKEESIQMTENRCKRCMEQNVYIAEIRIQAVRGARYQLMCNACGNHWYASSDEVLAVTSDGPPSASTTPVGTSAGGGPSLATAKFEDVEKSKESEKAASQVLKKTTQAYMPVVETTAQRSLNNNKQPRPPSSSEDAAAGETKHK